MSEEDAVREANDRFYRAFESLKLEAMEAAWAHDERVQCIHPGWDLHHHASHVLSEPATADGGAIA